MGHFKGRKGKSQITYVGNTVVSQKNLKYELLFETLIQFIVHDSTWMEPQALHEQILKITIWEILRKEVFSRPCPFIQILSRLYTDFIQILSKFFRNLLYPHFFLDFILILSGFYPVIWNSLYSNFIRILFAYNFNKVEIKSE